MNVIKIEPGSSTMEAACRLLAQGDLPTEDIAQPGVTLWAVEADGELIAVIGLETVGRTGLLRSLTVAPAHRGRRFGAQLCEMVFGHARQAGIDGLFLLTEDAAGFFEPLGFAVINRQQAPPEITATRQFSSLCPAEATLMRKCL